ncbi:integrating conjugative element protein [Pantoea ananatis]|uniref:integrating conjugative element protein n=1 Tax=Pantoea ananas TaxID=553 RepID=UPI002235701C|nr:integrating conjugative element protein [Pantoea ananatis]BBL32443.1 hypothetical protein PAFU01_38910 [Pantoea ananatis]
MMKRNCFIRNALFSACLLSVVTGASAALVVVGDLGGEPTVPYFDAINADKDAVTGAPAVPAAPTESLSISDMLPVSTPEMSPGPVSPQPLELSGMPPVFVLGDDSLSKQWLSRHAAALSQMHATGMVVSVKDAAALSALRALAPSTEMVPVSGGDLARRLHLAHYPVLITDKGLSQ